jgi:hypothetical protein
VGIGKETLKTTLYTPVYKGYGLTACASLSPKDAQDIESRGMFVGSFDINQLKLEAQKVQIIRMDDLKLNPYLVKVDIEGGELSALLGMKETLKRSRPVLIVECHKKEFNEMMNLLSELDYDLVDLESMRLLLNRQLITLVNHVFWPRELLPKSVTN